MQLTDTPRRIAVFRALFLGDLLCATPALRALRRRFPSAEITLIGLPWAEEFVHRSPSIDRFLRFPGYRNLPEGTGSRRQIDARTEHARRLRFDLAIQMHGDGRTTNGFVADLGAITSIGYRRLADDRLTISLPYVADEPEVERWLRLVGVLGAETTDTRLDFPVTSADQCRAADLLRSMPPRDGPLIGLHAGASAPERRWPAERFAQLADTLADRWNASIVLTGTAPEQSVTSVIRHLTQVPLLDLAGKTDLGSFAAIINQLDLLVTNDTGASHLASATGTPSVSIFSRASPYQWASLDRNRHLVVDARTFAPADIPPHKSLERLSLEPVLLACERQLNPAPTLRFKTKESYSECAV